VLEYFFVRWDELLSFVGINVKEVEVVLKRGD
jgi:hypothetical protein